MKTNLKQLDEIMQRVSTSNQARMCKLVDIIGWKASFEKELHEKYKELAKKRVSDIGADWQCFLIEEILDKEPDEILGDAV